MTANGFIQYRALLCGRHSPREPFGFHMTWVFNGKRTFLIVTFLCRVERVIYLLSRVPA